jgi:uncharacterized protein
MNRVVHFEIQADEPERAAQFYRDALGWEMEKIQFMGVDYWMVMTAPKDSTEKGINGGLLKRPAKRPDEMQGTNAYVCTVQTDNFDDVAEKITKAGGKVAMEKFAMPGMAWQGYFMDTEGNTFGLHQIDLDAK